MADGRGGEGPIADGRGARGEAARVGVGLGSRESRLSPSRPLGEMGNRAEHSGGGGTRERRAASLRRVVVLWIGLGLVAGPAIN